MALSKSSVGTAVKILKKIAETKLGILTVNEERQTLTGRVLGRDKKSDGGWESVFLNIKHITIEQRQSFESQKNEIGNSSFTKSMGDGITRIGWF